MACALFYTLIALFLLTLGGNWICGQLFKVTGLSAAIAQEPLAAPLSSHVAGRVIGVLERLILAAGIMFQRWEILAAVIALKSVARFKELEQRTFAEYFLVGSLFSVAWAMLLTFVWMAYDHQSGLDWRIKATRMIGIEAKAAK